MKGFRLGHLIVVVWEHEVYTTAVNIHIFAKDIAGHDGALNMPPWTTGAPVRLPGGLSGLACLPKSKVIGMFLFGTTTGKCSFTFRHFFGAGINTWLQFTVIVAFVFKSISIKVNTAIGFISKSVVNNALYVIHNLWDVLCDPGDNIRFLHPQSFHVLMKFFLKLPGMILINHLVCYARPKLLVQLSSQGIVGRSNQIFNRVRTTHFHFFYSSLNAPKLLQLKLRLGQGLRPFLHLLRRSPLRKWLLQLPHLLFQLLAHGNRRDLHIFQHGCIITRFE
mmetsp:Transcript_12038/g.18300  ORF Transcript_12038/g.18300 Transcript_12038/m.18300 type:complete len:278 (+) Transcript_12038:1962-2795(+)